MRNLSQTNSSHPMRVLFISGELIGSALIHRLINEGCEVKLYIKHVDRAACFDGIAEKVSDWESELDWVGKEGLIIFDDIIFSGAQDKLRADGYSVVGGDSKSDKLELDRHLFQEILREHCLPILPSHDFETPEQTESFVKKYPGPWVLKQNSHIGRLNYVGERNDGEDVMSMLQVYKEQKIKQVHLQKRIKGVEIGIARYFNGTDWVGPIEINLEHKRLFNGDIGPLTAEMGTVMWYDDNEESALFSATLKKIKPYLKEINYKGDIDINCIVEGKDIWPLEATTRFGTPAIALQCELHTSPWSEFLKAVADGESYNLKYNKGYGVVVAIAVPPFPFAPAFFGDSNSNVETSQGVSIFFKEDLSAQEQKQIHLEEVSRTIDKNQIERYYLSGKHGYALYVTGHGKNVAEAQKSAYRVVSKIIIPRMYYRTDIGDKFIKSEHQQLIDWGWL